jgi:hypothetical protein
MMPQDKIEPARFGLMRSAVIFENRFGLLAFGSVLRLTMFYKV